MNELYELKDGMYWNVEPEEVITQYIWYLKDKNKKQKEILDKIKEYITTRTPSDIGISGNKPKKYYTLSEDEVDYILELLEEIE